MKKSTLLITATLLVIFSMMIMFTACGDSDDNDILGKWQAYGGKSEDEIYSYEENYDNETAEDMKKRYLNFTGDGKVVSYYEDKALAEGRYYQEGSKYIMEVELTDDDTAQASITIEDGYLFVEQIVPDEYKGEVDSWDLTVYTKVD